LPKGCRDVDASTSGGRVSGDFPVVADSRRAKEERAGGKINGGGFVKAPAEVTSGSRKVVNPAERGGQSFAMSPSLASPRRRSSSILRVFEDEDEDETGMAHPRKIKLPSRSRLIVRPCPFTRTRQ
jgi:hypothetical protein